MGQNPLKPAHYVVSKANVYIVEKVWFSVACNVNPREPPSGVIYNIDHDSNQKIVFSEFPTTSNRCYNPICHGHSGGQALSLGIRTTCMTQISGLEVHNTPDSLQFRPPITVSTPSVVCRRILELFCSSRRPSMAPE